MTQSFIKHNSINNNIFVNNKKLDQNDQFH